MAIKGQPTKFYDKTAAILEIDGIEYAGFTTLSPVEEEMANISHREGGGKDALNHDGNVTRPEITLERGFSDSTELWDWYVACRDGTLSADEKKKNGRIIQRDEAGADAVILDIGPCYPRKCGYGGWDKGAEEAVYETCIIVWDGPLKRSIA